MFFECFGVRRGKPPVLGRGQGKIISSPWKMRTTRGVPSVLENEPFVFFFSVSSAFLGFCFFGMMFFFLNIYMVDGTYFPAVFASRVFVFVLFFG